MSDWIPISERVPELEANRNCSAVVLVYGKGGFITPRRWWRDSEISGSFGQICGTHWMPLPPPPKQ